MELREDCCLIPAFGNNHDGKTFCDASLEKKDDDDVGCVKVLFFTFYTPLFFLFLPKKTFGLSAHLFSIAHRTHDNKQFIDKKRQPAHPPHTHTHQNCVELIINHTYLYSRQWRLFSVNYPVRTV
jgi:hypothetical protein